ncbi:hypothetical protein TYRP_012476 [Tyrophagus putrescentiae]|nr:hypothetical protein TYRP_012476 [Tyrophagus putrescentiae]
MHASQNAEDDENDNESLDYSNKDNERGSGDKARAACAGNVANSTRIERMMIKRPAPVRWQRRPAKRADACTNHLLWKNFEFDNSLISTITSVNS